VGKLKELCEQLAQIDYDAFRDNCQPDEDGPEWRKELFEDLTEEQEKKKQKHSLEL